MLKRLWNKWKQIAKVIGNFQARVLLTVFYFVIIFPFGMAVRLFSDPLRIKRPPRQWLDHPVQAYNVDSAGKQ